MKAEKQKVALLMPNERQRRNTTGRASFCVFIVLIMLCAIAPIHSASAVYADYNYDGTVACTMYAWTKAREWWGVSFPDNWGHAGYWYGNAGAPYTKDKNADLYSIACWSIESAGNGVGHVALVTEVGSNYIKISEGGSHWAGATAEGICNRTIYTWSTYEGKSLWPDQGFIHLKPSEPSVSFSPWSNDQYTSIGYTNAAIGQEINAVGGTCTETGMYLYDANGNYLAKVSQNEYYYRIYFDINSELHYTLSEGTTYKYKFYAIMDGKTYWSEMQSFVTLGTPSTTVSFSNWENGNYTYIGTTDAAIGQEITFSSGSCTETGMYLYDSSENYLASASQSEYYYRIYFKVNEELHYTLKANTTYKYKFYAVINGKYYWSNFQSFKTNGLTVTFSTWENGHYTFIGETNAAIGQEINLSGGTCTVTGMYLYDNSGNYLAKAEQDTYYYRIYFNINDELGYTLQPGVLYKYRFFAIVDGSTYWSDIQTFQTSGSSFIITYDANGGYNAPAQQYVNQSASVVYLVSSVPARTGYSFLGWASSSQAESPNYQPGATYSGRSSVTLYAVWGEETTAEIYWKDNYCYPYRKSAYVTVDITASQSGVFSETCIKVWDGDGTLVAEKHEEASGTRQHLLTWYDIYTETGVSLNTGATYTYQFSTIFEGKVYESPVMYFSTTEAGSRHFGIDVSQHNGTIDWDTASQFIDFAIIRCGFGGDYTANDDSQWAVNVAACERLGIPYGVYLYSYAENDEEALGEAEHVIRLLSGHNPSLPIYYDLEDAGTVGNLSNEQIASQISVFTNRLRKSGYKVGIYSNASWWSGHLSGLSVANDCKWFAAWSGNYAAQGSNYALWQFTSDGSVPGINVRVDLNYSYAYQFGTIPSTEPVVIDPDFILPTSLITIEEEAFVGGAFQYVILSEKTTTIGRRAFADCPNLRHIYIPETTTSISPYAFENVTGLTIHGPDGSYAEFFAQKYGYTFEVE